MGMLQTQFDSAPESPIRNRVPGQMISIFNPVNSHCLLRVAPPFNSQMQSNLAADRLAFLNGKTWYVWDVSKISALGDFFASGIQTDFEMVDLVRNRENTVFWTSLKLGVGIPTLISSVLELLKVIDRGTSPSNGHNRRADVNSKRKNQKGKVKTSLSQKRVTAPESGIRWECVHCPQVWSCRPCNYLICCIHLHRIGHARLFHSFLQQ